MIEFRSIHLRDFGPFKDATLEYAPSGLVLVQGENRDSITADSNMSGKTTLLTEALLWCLFGSGTKERGPTGAKFQEAKVGDVIRHGTGGCQVSLKLEKDGTSYTVLRLRDGSGTTLQISDGKKWVTRGKSVAETQQYVEQILGLGYDSFCQTVLFGQGSKRFLAARDVERKRIVEELLGLGRYRLARENAVCARKTCEKRVSDAGRSLETLTVQLETSRSQLYQATGRYNKKRDEYRNWKTEQQKRETELKARQQKLTEQIAQRQQQVQELRQQADEPREGPSTKEAEVQVQRWETRQAEALTICTRLQTQQQASEQRLKELERLATCPTCEQEVPVSHRKRLDTEVRLELGRTEVALQDARTRLKECKQKLGASKQQLQETVQQTRQRQEMQNRIQLLELREKSDSGHLETIRASLLDLTTTRTLRKPDRGEIEEAEKAIATLEGLERKAKEKQEAARQQLREVEFWVEGFGPRGIISLLLDQVLPVLNETTNGYLQQLLGSEVSVEFEIENEKFDVRVQGEAGEGYHLASGGERRRIDFAVALALQKLQVSTGARCNLYICDEPFESIDETGTEQLVDLLRHFAYENGVCVYVITHLTGLKALFDSTVTVRKETGISKLLGVA